MVVVVESKNIDYPQHLQVELLGRVTGVTQVMCDVVVGGYQSQRQTICR
jgi:hypothetical protein